MKDFLETVGKAVATLIIWMGIGAGLYLVMAAMLWSVLGWFYIEEVTGLSAWAVGVSAAMCDIVTMYIMGKLIED